MTKWNKTNFCYNVVNTHVLTCSIGIGISNRNCVHDTGWGAQCRLRVFNSHCCMTAQRIQRTPFPWSRCNQLLGQLGDRAGGCWRLILQEMTGHFCSQQTLPPVSLLLTKVARQPQLFLKRTAMSLQEGPPVAAEDLRPNCSVHGAMGEWLEVPWQTLKYPCILSILSRHYSIISIFILHAWLTQGSMTCLSPGGVSDLQTCPAVWRGPADLGEWCTKPVHYCAPARGSYFQGKRGGEWRFLKVFA